ncbi:MAG: Rossmann-like domain-containing protein [Candidatus Helarchaeota archaeon]
MSVLNNLIDTVIKYWKKYRLNLKIKDLSIGPHFAICILNNDSTGVCHNISVSKCKPDINELRRNTLTFSEISKQILLDDKFLDPLSLITLAKSDIIFEKILGIACINAISQHILVKFNKNLSFDNKRIAGLDINPDFKIGIIGSILPIIRQLKEKNVKKIFLKEFIEEKIPVSLSGISIVNNLEFIDEINVLLITGSSLVNGTIDEILEKGKNCSECILIGPTASCIPNPLFKRGLTRIAGTMIIAPFKVRDIILNGGGTRDFKKFGKKYFIKKG